MLYSLKSLPLIVSIWFVCSACAPAFIQSDPEDMAQFATAHTLNAGKFELGYVQAGSPGRTLIVFVHGTPGSWHAFADFLRDPRLQACCHMIAVDRLGFGASAVNGVQPDFAVQSAAIAHTFSLNQTDHLVLAGHSLGGSIAADLAVRYPEAVDALMIISAALDPELAKPRWYHRLAALPLVRRVIPPDLRLANEEMLDLVDSMQTLATGLAELKIPVHIVQGGRDPLVDPDHPGYAEQRLTPAQLKVHRFPDDGHFIIWEQPDFIVTQLLDLVTSTEP